MIAQSNTIFKVMLLNLDKTYLILCFDDYLLYGQLNVLNKRILLTSGGG